MQTRAVYLNGESLDRGKLTLGNKSLRFSGWQGKIEFPLPTVTDIELGSSALPPRAGIPVLQKVWPGKPRQAQTMIFSVQDASNPEPLIAVVADLPDAHDWRREIRSAQERLEDVIGQRADLDRQRAEAEARVAKTKADLALAQDGVNVVQREIGQLKAQKSKIEAQQREVDRARQQAVQARRTASKQKGRK